MSASLVHRASKENKAEMLDVIASLNELAEEDERFSLELTSRTYVVVVKSENSEYRGSMMRCDTCGHIRELFEGQIAFCDSCGVD